MAKLDDIEVADILDYEGIEYRETSGSSGEQLNLRECPTCGNAKYKVYLNAETGFGNCFVCDTKFNRWTFLADYLGTRDRKAIRDFISKMSRDLGYRPKKKMKVLAETDDLQAKLPQSIPLPDRKGRNSPYLEERGITGEYAKRFNLRLCQYGAHTYIKDGKEIDQRFDDRIIIPVFDLYGDLVTFQGRDISGKSDRKYLFPARLPATARYLYNGHEALALRATEVILCEGAFDVIPVAKACDLYPEMHKVVPVGSFGKDLTDTKSGPGQVDALRTLKQKGALKAVTIMWDGEQSALLAALDAATKIKGIGLNAKIALLPQGCDPNEVTVTQIRDSYFKAYNYSRLLGVRWRTHNPYK